MAPFCTQDEAAEKPCQTAIHHSFHAKLPIRLPQDGPQYARDGILSGGEAHHLFRKVTYRLTAFEIPNGSAVRRKFPGFTREDMRGKSRVFRSAICASKQRGRNPVADVSYGHSSGCCNPERYFAPADMSDSETAMDNAQTLEWGESNAV
jgi:hypothetical protein